MTAIRGADDGLARLESHVFPSETPKRTAPCTISRRFGHLDRQGQANAANRRLEDSFLPV